MLKYEKSTLFAGRIVVAVEQEVDEVVRIEVVHVPALERDVEGLATGTGLRELDGTREELDLHVETDRLQVVLHDLAGRRSCSGRVERVEDALAAAGVPAERAPRARATFGLDG